ncbi:hypothetical protein RRG08_067418 [Elysia crispata]|uniref:Uncharacterized protein n=1 Tax=Elysia crispata TaxID=231223 RepID=A0AAE0XS41_9GAST|nr:hypothetical protein RRG08_067418 [Elysia crispata]
MLASKPLARSVRMQHMTLISSKDKIILTQRRKEDWSLAHSSTYTVSVCPSRGRRVEGMLISSYPGICRALGIS